MNKLSVIVLWLLDIGLVLDERVKSGRYVIHDIPTVNRVGAAGLTYRRRL